MQNLMCPLYVSQEGEQQPERKRGEYRLKSQGQHLDRNGPG